MGRALMIAAACLFFAGCLTGLYFRLAAIVALSGLATLCFAALWIVSGTFTGMDALVWLAAMTAIQMGYVIGSFVAARTKSAAADPDSSPEPDRRSAQP